MTTSEDSSEDDPATGEPDAGRARRGRKGGRLRAAGLVALQLLLIAVVFFQVNYLSCRRHTTWDLTQNRRFTLSDTTRSFLGSVSGEVRVVMAFLGTSDIYGDVKGLISEYDRIGGDVVTAEFLDISRSRARIAELKDQHDLDFRGNQIVILGESGRVKVVDAEELVTRDPESGRVARFNAEQVLTGALLEVTERQQRQIYLVSGGRRSDELVPIAGQLQPLAKAQNARLESLVLEGRRDVPGDADALFFPGNGRDLTERELDFVRDYWNEEKGGLVLFLDPAADTPNLDTFLREHGVGPRDDRVLSVLSIPGVTAKRSYDVPATLMPGNGPTRDMSALSLRLTGQTQSLEVLGGDDVLRAENIRPTPLMVARQGFWGETDFEAEEVSYNPDDDHGRPDPVYVAASVEKGEPGDPQLDEGASRLVVVGNADLISPDGNNPKVAEDFTMNAINWVMDREEMVGISPRQPTEFTLNIDAGDFGLLQTITIFLMPGTALVLAGVVWMRRRA